jgi:acyl-CoA thioesterase
MTTPQHLAEEVVSGMRAQDGFSAWLGIELLDIQPGRCTLRMTVRPDMLNGFGVCHGGVTFALADSAMAFASNTHGRVTMSVDNSISYIAPVRAGDVLRAEATREGEGGPMAFYRVTVTSGKGDHVAIFRGTVYMTKRPHAGVEALLEE